MKRYIIGMMTIFFIYSISAMAYVSPLETMELEEVRRAAAEREAMEEERERLSRATDMWNGDKTRVRVISYPDPATGYGPLGEYHMVEALEYEYPDGTIEVKSLDGRVLKDRE